MGGAAAQPLQSLRVNPAKTVFISYAHADRRWLNRVRVHLAPITRHDEIAAWSDQNIASGEKWQEEIASQLETARVALLLVSPAFLASDYIANSELPVLLKRAHDDGLTILPLLIYPSAWDIARFRWPDPIDGPEELTLSSMQAVGSPSETLSELPRPKQDRVLVAMTKRIHALLTADGGSRTPPSPPRATREERLSSISISHLPSGGEFLIGRERELLRITDAWDSDHEHILTIIGRGGEGKSNLVRHWLNDMAAKQWRGAERVYGWSFYSQGMNDKAASADQFIDQALRFFGEANPESLRSAEARGERLAQLVGARRNLVILDGLEPLQYPSGAMRGRLKDPALQTLLSGLLVQNRGLCIITTRENLPDFANTKHSLSPEIELPPLSPAAGAKLLADLGVTGSEEERESVSRRLGGHAISIHLLGTYLAEVYNGDVSHANEVALLSSGYGDHARHILASYEKWLSGQTISSAVDEDLARNGAKMLAVLRLLGLFDRPATMAAIDVLRAAPAIPSLTEPLVGISEAEWKRTLARLRNLQLIDHDLGEVETLDAHPLLREYFAEQLERTADSAQEAHKRLFEHFKTVAPDKPATLEEMAPLFQAVVHGCKAGKWQEALDEVFYTRIEREAHAFAGRTLGASGACVAALSAFFKVPWRELGGSFAAGAQSYLIGAAGYYLGDIGRLDESTEPILTALDIADNSHDALVSSIHSHNLSAIYLATGDVATALTFGERSVESAVRNGDPFVSHMHASEVAEILEASGKRRRALLAYKKIDKAMARDTSTSGLYALPGLKYANLLVDFAMTSPKRAARLAQIRSLQQRQRRDIERSNPALYDLGLDHVVSARLDLFDGGAAHGERDFHEAVSLLRQAGKVMYVPIGLLARAEFHRLAGNRELAERDLNELEQLSERHGMLRWRIEATVERAKFHAAFGESAAVRETIAEAKRLIKATEKPYVPHVWTYDEAPKPDFIGVFKEGELVGYHRCDDAIAELERHF
jgi:tetratricopeptide (TPR) repeat protein